MEFVIIKIKNGYSRNNLEVTKVKDIINQLEIPIEEKIIIFNF